MPLAKEREERFAFGQNWSDFISQHLNADRLAEAKRSLVNFAGLENIKDKTFLDIGCGSGIFSLAAIELGASKVLSFDYDLDSVQCCQRIKEEFAADSNWHIEQGSILDQAYLDQLGDFDFVYSWGVLHHTGSMWQAIENSANLVSQDGNLYIAIYNKSDGFSFFPDGRLGNSKLWEIEKKIYVNLPRFFQWIIDSFAMSAMVVVYLLTLKNPFAKIKEHKELRGMSWAIDIKDWLGGYPYEYASTEEIFKFLKPKGFKLENLISHNGLRCNEFLFSR